MKTARCVFFFFFAFLCFSEKKSDERPFFFHIYNIPPRKINSGRFLLGCIFPEDVGSIFSY